MEPVRVLIVEDESSLARSLCRALALARSGHYMPETCSSGEAALARLPGCHFGVIVTDLRLGGMDGLALIARVQEFCPETRSILITAYGSPEVEAAASSSADCYLAKPFGLQEFLAAVGRLAAL